MSFVIIITIENKNFHIRNTMTNIIKVSANRHFNTTFASLLASLG